MSQQIICPRGASLYIWRQGDTLASVALRNRVTVQSIYLVNEGRDLDALRPGDRICLPPGMYACLSGQAYTVRRGDTFASIAQAYGITTWELIERNPYVDPSNLMVGQVLCVPEEAQGEDGEEDSGGTSCAGCCPASASRAGRCADLAPAFRAGFGSWVRAGRCAAFCAGFRAGAALRRAYSGTGPSVGIVSPVSFWMSQRYSNSSSEQNDHAAPSCPARPVRPMRWT